MVNVFTRINFIDCYDMSSLWMAYDKNNFVLNSKHLLMYSLYLLIKNNRIAITIYTVRTNINIMAYVRSSHKPSLDLTNRLI